MNRTKRTQSLCVIGLAAAVILSPAQAADDAKLIADGKALFQSKICFTCHQVDENVPAPAGIAMKAPKFIGGFWGKKRTVTLGYGGPDATVTFDEAYFAESVRKPMDKVSKEAAAPMPPPPAVNDEEMKALIAYVRSLSEGGSAEDPNGLIAKGKINNFTYAAYKGSWNKLPDFSKLKPFKTGTAKSGTADPGLAGVGENFGVVFEGDIEIERKGSYTFNLGSDDGTRLYINGKLVVDNDGVHGMQAKKGKLDLEPGAAKLKLEYFEKSGEEQLALDMSGPGIKRLQLAKQTIKPQRRGQAFPTGNPITITDEARIYRNFIEGASPRGIGVGYPEKVNLCFDANTMQIAMLWHGAFMDAARHWNGRGQGFQRPSGHYLINLTRDQPFAQLDSADAAWPRAESRDTRAVGPPVSRLSTPRKTPAGVHVRDRKTAQSGRPYHSEAGHLAVDHPHARRQRHGRSLVSRCRRKNHHRGKRRLQHRRHDAARELPRLGGQANPPRQWRTPGIAHQARRRWPSEHPAAVRMETVTHRPRRFLK